MRCGSARRVLAAAGAVIASAAGAACGGRVDAGAQDAAVDRATDAPPPPPQPPPMEAGPEAAPPPPTGQSCASAGYACDGAVDSHCPSGSFPAAPPTQDCPAGQLCCEP